MTLCLNVNSEYARHIQNLDFGTYSELICGRFSLVLFAMLAGEKGRKIVVNFEIDVLIGSRLLSHLTNCTEADAPPAENKMLLASIYSPPLARCVN